MKKKKTKIKKTKELETKSSCPNFGICQIYTISKFIKEEIEKNNSLFGRTISIWKCGLGILDIGNQLKSLEHKWI